MISHEDIKNLVNEWQLREDIIEKDYVIGWVLWGIGADPDINHKWVFKGGTCLKKCYIETYRFSEDLDFTILDDGPINVDELVPIIDRTLERIGEESGIDFSVAKPKFKQRASSQSIEGRIYYRGPRNARTPASIKLDLSALEKVARPSVLKKISHPYPDDLPNPAHIRSYSFEEVFAEKVRAMGERSRPRDLYDIINLFRRRDLQTHPKLIRTVLIEKCKTKGVPVPTYNSIKDSPYIDELEGEWQNMLGHQLQILPPFEQFWKELPLLFDWLEETYVPETLSTVAVGKEEDPSWTPPPTIWNWGIGIPIESIRFAGANQLCIELEYKKQGHYLNHYILEPYSLRRTKEKKLILHAIKAGTQEHRTFRVDWIQGIKVSTKPFVPKYQIEFTSIGPINAPILTRSRLTGSSTTSIYQPSRTKTKKYKSSHDYPYTIECSFCGKKFKRKYFDTKLNSHKDKNGFNCPGKIGFIV